jgi:hypothetical protein
LYVEKLLIILPCPQLREDDIQLTFSKALMTVMFSLQYEAETWAWSSPKSPHFMTMKQFTHSAMVGSISLPFWAWSTGLVKISIALMLLRFQQSRGWQIFLYLMIAINVMLIAVLGIANLFQCIPYRAWWDFTVVDRKCWSYQAMLATTYLSGACNVSTDIVSSLMPLTFLGKIRRPTREKVAIGILMALGLIASGFSMSKVIITARARTTGQFISPTVLGLLSCLEVQTSLIAACIPTLRSSSKRLLTKLGIKWSVSRHTTYRRYGSGSSESGPKAAGRPPMMELKDVSFGGSGPHFKSETLNMEEEDDEYHMDPETGRITHKAGLRLHSSRSEQHNEWRIDAIPARGIGDDELEAERTIGIAQ